MSREASCFRGRKPVLLKRGVMASELSQWCFSRALEVKVSRAISMRGLRQSGCSRGR